VDEGKHLIVERRDAESWKPQYRFTLDSYKLDDFSEMCRIIRPRPNRRSRKSVCTLATANGRITVTGMRLIVTEGGEKTKGVCW
jgi:N-hydroxyarylamine O-acetyltransferase